MECIKDSFLRSEKASYLDPRTVRFSLQVLVVGEIVADSDIRVCRTGRMGPHTPLQLHPRPSPRLMDQVSSPEEPHTHIWRCQDLDALSTATDPVVLCGEFCGEVTADYGGRLDGHLPRYVESCRDGYQYWGPADDRYLGVWWVSWWMTW